jgi:hypothetical protein
MKTEFLASFLRLKGLTACIKVRQVKGLRLMRVVMCLQPKDPIPSVGQVALSLSIQLASKLDKNQNEAIPLLAVLLHFFAY